MNDTGLRCGTRNVKRFEPATVIGIKQRGLDGRRFLHQLVLFAHQRFGASYAINHQSR